MYIQISHHLRLKQKVFQGECSHRKGSDKCKKTHTLINYDVTRFFFLEIVAMRLINELAHIN